MPSSQTLMSQHADLDRQISMEMKRPVPDSTVLQNLKKQKLATKEKLEQIRH